MSNLGKLFVKARENVSFWGNIFYTILFILVVLNIFIVPHHPHFELEKFPGFWALFGCLAAIALTKICKGAAHTFLGKDEDFYDRN
jgi:uncharacterized membrane protein HdeD (DUF308 family)